LPQGFLHIQNILNLAQEPGVNAGDPVDVVDGTSLLQGRRNVEEPVFVGDGQLFLDDFGGTLAKRSASNPV
jgi:hypothetical protein